MFKVGDRVVVNGFYSNGEPIDYIKKWENEKTVLTIFRDDDEESDEGIFVVGTTYCDDETYNFDKEELRYATDKEIIHADKNITADQNTMRDELRDYLICRGSVKYEGNITIFDIRDTDVFVLKKIAEIHERLGKLENL